MEIQALPKGLYKLLSEQNLLTPKMCYMNCLRAVLNMSINTYPDVTYVLCKVKYLNETLPHAVIKFSDNYYDPTLEPQQLHCHSHYEITYEISKEDLIRAMLDRFGKEKVGLMLNGELPFWPLILDNTGSPSFIDA